MSFADYRNQSELVLRVLPAVMKQECFALKGGTAINLFIRDMPRLSVDIDLAYLPLKSRDASLKDIDFALARIAEDIESRVPGTRVQHQKDGSSRRTKALFVRRKDAAIKIEPNLVIRGCVYPPMERRLTRAAETFFGLSASAQVLSAADLYGGKICAALDRQHPRDLFDAEIMLAAEGLPEQVRKAFIIYLASHERPMHELLHPKRKDIRRVFETDFVDMTRQPVVYEDLLRSREVLIRTIQTELTQEERLFMLSIKKAEPDWSLLGVPGIDRLPAIQWKLQNIRSMDKSKHRRQLEALRIRLGI